jgi:HEAT repeat protein
MLDPKHLKVQGLRYGRSLQMLVRICSVFSVDHPSAIAPAQNSFDTLNALLKQAREFSFGFVDNRVVLNNILTAEPGLHNLENEFLKRGVGAVKFRAGLTLAAYKQVIAVLCTSPKLIEDVGGTRAFLDEHSVENARILPAGKNQARTESGDTILESDVESYMASKELAESGAQNFALDGLEVLLKTAGLEKPPDFAGGPADIMRLVGPTVDAALLDQRGDIQKSTLALATILNNMRPDLVLPSFPAERHEELRQMAPSQVASEYVEERAAEFVAKRLKSAPSDEEGLVIEEDVLRVIGRSLRATQTAERLLAKLARYVRDYALPPAVLERIKQEMKWSSLSPKEQMATLLQLKLFGPTEFRRLMEVIKERLEKAKLEEATQLALHYLKILELPIAKVRPEELSRLPELMRAMGGVRTDFGQSTAERLATAHARRDFSPTHHMQVANAMVALANAVAAFEDYGVIQILGTAFERALAADASQHAHCCGRSLGKLLPPTPLDRLVELVFQRKDDAAWMKAATSLFRWSGPTGIEKLFLRLQDEKTAATRMMLMRFISQTGHAGLEVARKRLSDERWYVVRNACQVLGELKDPELLQQLAPVLGHADDRVQKAAVDVLNKSRIPARAQVFAEELPHLRANNLERALDELMFLKNPATLPALERFVFGDSEARTKVLEKAVQAVTYVPGDAALELLSRVLADPGFEATARKLALHALVRAKSERGRKLLAAFVSGSPGDPLAEEAQRALAPAPAT